MAVAAQDGMEVELSYIGEGVQNVSGGIRKGSQYLSTGDFSITIDTEKMGLWQGGTCFVETLVNQGQDPSRFIGDVQTASNISDGNRTNLQQLWCEQALGEHASLLLGLHDLNSEFYTSEYASWFLNSSFGIGPDVSANTNASLWPRAGWAARLDIHRDDNYLHLATYDGDPATRGVDVANEGLMWIAEAGHLAGASAYKIGFWRHTGKKTAPDGRVYPSNSGLYAVVDQALTPYLGSFLQFGKAQVQRSDISQYIGAGLLLHHIIPNHLDDVIGLAMARATFSHVYRTVNQSALAETAVELTYDATVSEHISLHPAFQWIQHPGGQAALSPAKVVMLRVEVHLP